MVYGLHSGQVQGHRAYVLTRLLQIQCAVYIGITIFSFVYMYMYVPYFHQSVCNDSKRLTKDRNLMQKERKGTN